MVTPYHHPGGVVMGGNGSETEWREVLNTNGQ